MSQTMMTAVFSFCGLPAFSARRRSSPGKLNVAKPVRPMFMNPRRLTGPGQRTTEDGFDEVMILFG